MHTKLGTRLLRKGIDLSGLNPSLTPEFHTRVASVLTQRISLSVQTNSPRGAPRTDRRPSGNLRREIVIFRPPSNQQARFHRSGRPPSRPRGRGVPTDTSTGVPTVESRCVRARLAPYLIGTRGAPHERPGPTPPSVCDIPTRRSRLTTGRSTGPWRISRADVGRFGDHVGGRSGGDILVVLGHAE